MGRVQTVVLTTPNQAAAFRSKIETHAAYYPNEIKKAAQ